MSKILQLLKSYRKANTELFSRLEKFQNNPTPNEVHDLRTSLRRLEAIIDVLPKGVRKRKKVKAYLSACRKLFRSTTAVRDIDVVYQNVQGHSNSPKVLVAISTIQLERNQEVSNSLQLAESVRKMKSPKIRKSALSSKEISKRSDKIVQKLLAKLQEELPVVIGDFRRIRELHDMRKECKKLRYTLELFPSEDNARFTGLMKDWQSLLGAIRDIDITQQFAEEKGLLEDLEEVLMSLRISRDKMLGTFRSTAKLEEQIVPAKLGG